MLAFSPEVLSGPGGAVVAAVCEVGPAADRRVVADVVAAVAAGRSTTRRLAQALLDRPSVLTDGRTSAPRVAAHLLHALRELGVVVSAPRCTTCAKELATFSRRGQDWYCTPCGRTPQACAACGKMRAVTSR